MTRFALQWLIDFPGTLYQEHSAYLLHRTRSNPIHAAGSTWRQHVLVTSQMIITSEHCAVPYVL